MHRMISNRHTSDRKKCKRLHRGDDLHKRDLWNRFSVIQFDREIIDVEVDQHTEKCSTQSKVLKVKISLMSCALLRWNLLDNFIDF